MQLEEALFSHLSGYAGLTALVGTRIKPLVKPQKTRLPAVTIQRISGPRVHCQGSDPGIAYPRIQVTAWADNYKEAKLVAAQIISALQDFSGTMGGVGGVDIEASFLEDDLDLFDEQSEVYFVPVDFIIWHHE